MPDLLVDRHGSTALLTLERRDRDFDDHVHHVHHVFLRLPPLFGSSDSKEGMTAFPERRRPEFRGR
jgi:hypothetical protein